MARALSAIIDCKALKHNLQQVRGLAPQARILAMIKSNGYGHGILTVAEALQEADGFGVACLEEGLQLRRANIHHRIVLMEGFFKATELQDIVRFELEPVIHHSGQIEALTQLNSLVKVWIKINTGMHRLGFTPEAFLSAYQTLDALKNVKIQGVISHFARADELNHPMTQQQIDRFQEVTQFIHTLNPVKSLANSAGILGWKASHQDWVRPGIMLYGVSPFSEQLGSDFGLQPVMTLSSEIIAVQQLKKGDSLGYGGAFVCRESMPVGVVAAGYGDGYPRLAVAGTPVLVNEQRVPLIGRVSMDMLTVDLRDQPDAKVGDPVVLWGSGLPVETVAKAIGTLGYELLTGLSARVPLEIRG